jgi:hypothetical protein
MPPFDEGRAYCFAAVGLSAVSFIFFALVAHTEMKFGIQLYHIKEYLCQVSVLGTIELFMTELCPLDFEKFE